MRERINQIDRNRERCIQEDGSGEADKGQRQHITATVHRPDREKEQDRQIERERERKRERQKERDGERTDVNAYKETAVARPTKASGDTSLLPSTGPTEIAVMVVEEEGESERHSMLVIVPRCRPTRLERKKEKKRKE
jgi:hypothetical protein